MRLVRLSFILLIASAASRCEPSNVITTTVNLPTSPSFIPTSQTTTPCSSGQTSCQSTCPTGSCSGTGTGFQSPSSRTPEVLSFSSDSPRIAKHNPVVLRWEISDPSASVRIDPSIGSVSSTGFITLFPTTTTTYTLTARNSNGIAQRQLTIIVFTPE